MRPPSGSCARDDTKQVARPLANFCPDIWGDYFLNHNNPIDEVTKTQKEEEAKELRELVRKEILGEVKDPKERLIFIDAIERLGVAYHFEEEIEANLQNFHKKNYDDHYYNNDLQYVSLHFRILRQHGFYVSCDGFKKFKGEDRSFKVSLTSDVEGLLRMYEAVDLKVKGEDILDEALKFTTFHLKSVATQLQLNSVMAKQVKHALNRSLHKCTPRLESRYQISFYAQQPSHDHNLLRLAKLDFDLLQLLHKEELQELTRWWRKLDLVRKLPYVRDRLVEGYFWTLGVYYEPKYSFARILFAKLFKFTSVINDTYDAYATLDELEPFTQAILGWNRSCTAKLPDYMKIIYEALLDTTEQYELGFLHEGRAYAFDYLRQEMKDLCEAYLQEVKWRDTNYIATYDEYMRNGIMSAGYFKGIVESYLGMGEVANKHAFEWLRQRPKAASASCILARLVNDIASSKFEKNRKHVAQAVECYAAQYKVSSEKAVEELQRQVDEAWEDLTEAMFRPNDVPMPLLTRILNLSRVLHEVYEIDQDGYTMGKYTQHKVMAVLVNDTTVEL